MRYLLCCTSPEHQLAALDASPVVNRPGALPKGAGGDRRVVPLADGDTAPDLGDCCTLASDAEWTDAVTGAQFTAPWIAHTDTPAWTGSEKGVLVPEADGTAALVQAAAATWGDIEGGWDVCERIVLASETTIGGNTYAAGTYRLVRYTGARPSALSSYAVLYAAGVAEAVTRAGSVEGA